MTDDSPIIDFLQPKSQYRLAQNRGRSELIAKAVGWKEKHKPYVIDATAGLGRDAFILATLGCKVLMLERSEKIAALLENALNEAKKQPQYADLKLDLLQVDAIHFLSQLIPDQYPDVIYLDPMYPERTKSALVKKEMRLLRKVVGDDQDTEQLFAIALQRTKRVVVKRPRLAPTLLQKKSSIIFKGNNSRFDVYIS